MEKINQDLFESLKKEGADLVSSCDLAELPMDIRSGLDTGISIAVKLDSQAVPPVLIYVREVLLKVKIGKQVYIGMIFSMLGLAGKQLLINPLLKQVFKIPFVVFALQFVLGQKNMLEIFLTIKSN